MSENRKEKTKGARAGRIGSIQGLWGEGEGASLAFLIATLAEFLKL